MYTERHVGPASRTVAFCDSEHIDGIQQSGATHRIAVVTEQFASPEGLLTKDFLTSKYFWEEGTPL
jgi:hypothetical protein